MISIQKGKFKKKKLFKFDYTGIRPSSFLIRRAVFDILRCDWSFCECEFIDLFAGTASIGIEALSQNFQWVHLIDNDPIAIKLIKKNIQVTFPSQNYKIYNSDAVGWLRNFPAVKKCNNSIFF